MKIKLLIIFLFIVLIAAFFPFLASTPVGSPLFIKFLESRLHGELQCKKISLSWMGPQRFENVLFTKPDLIAKIDLFESDVPFWRLSFLNASFALQNGTLTFPTYENQKITNIQARIQDNQILATGTTPQGGDLEIQGTIKSRRDFDISANLRKIPTIAIDELLKFHGILHKAVGPTLTLNGSLAFVQNRGTLACTLNAPNATLSLNGAIANDILTLNQPLTANCHFPPDFLKEIISPTLLTNISSENPFSLTISPQGFSCPIHPLSLDKIQIEKALVNLGKMRGTPGESLYLPLQLLKNQEVGKTINLWFAPFACSLQKGLIHLGRVDALLAESIHLCSWGEINIPKDQLQMILGIPADTLEQSFGIQNLSRNYVLKIPIRGSLQNPELDTSLAIAKIAALKTTGKIPTKGGKIFGKLVNVFTQQDEGETPAPQRPFPWEK